MAEKENMEQLSTEDKPKPQENVDEIILEKQPIKVKEPQTENMEVHHPHHVTHKKKWTEYLLEFFMLFLAVFLGFVAENIREHSVERTREKEYMVSIVNDLKTDTSNLAQNIRSFDGILNGQDSILRNFNSIGKILSPFMQRRMGDLTGFPDFVYSDGTIQQLKNSGGLRLLHNRKVVDSILVYDAEVSKTLLNQKNLSSSLQILDNSRFHFFNYRAIDSISFSGNTANPDMQYLTKKADPEDLYSKIKQYNWIMEVVRYNMSALKEKGTSTLQFVKKEYHLENE